MCTCPRQEPHLRDVVFPRRVRNETHRGTAHAVVGIPQRQEVVVAAIQAGHHDGHVVRLRPGVHEVRYLRARDTAQGVGTYRLVKMAQ